MFKYPPPLERCNADSNPVRNAPPVLRRQKAFDRDAKLTSKL